MGLFRNFKIYEGVVFHRLRGEGFNVLNHTNWQAVGTTFYRQFLRSVTTTRDPRILQVAGKITF